MSEAVYQTIQYSKAVTELVGAASFSYVGAIDETTVLKYVREGDEKEVLDREARRLLAPINTSLVSRARQRTALSSSWKNAHRQGNKESPGRVKLQRRLLQHITSTSFTTISTAIIFCWTKA